MADKPANETSILLVEDDLEVAATVIEMLETAGYQVAHAEDGSQARMKIEQMRPDLVVLDLILPDVDGLVLCGDLKAIANVPIIICSGTTRKRDTVLGLKLGADDFVQKPFDLYEFEARVEAVLRRSAQTKRVEPAPQPDELRVGDLVVDRSRHRITLGDESIQLTPIEYRLLGALCARPDEVLSREELAQIVWGYQDASVGRTIDVHIRRLRVKLSSVNTPSPPIVSVRGFGYKISPEEARRPVALVS